MPRRISRRHESWFRWIRGAAFAILVWWALSGLGLTPSVASPLLGGIIGLVAVFSPPAAVVAAIAALSIPMLAADLVTGIVFLVIGFASIQYLAHGQAQTFLLICAAVLLAWVGPLWAAAAIAGTLLGTSAGAPAAFLAALAVQAAGVLAGETHVSLVTTGVAASGTGLLAEAPGNMLSFGWLMDSLAAPSPLPLLETASAITAIPLLLLQPLAWAVGATVAGLLSTRQSESPHAPRTLLAALSGVVAAGALHVSALAAFDRMPGANEIIVAAGGSLLVALAVTALNEWVFPPLPRAATSSAPTSSSLSTEDADVDELLSLIAHAEDELATRHTVDACVMITDMKSFSAITEEDGSVTSAKMIQRHRDLLIPIIERGGGSGKSTGGDGLVAAFPDAAAAVVTAVNMQKALGEHNRAHPSGRAIAIRVGIATGEVVLDRSGRPFIGTALNLAARIMNLGDGGQILVSAPVAAAASGAGLRTHHHGAYDLKNIGDPVLVDEVLWEDGQEPGLLHYT